MVCTGPGANLPRKGATSLAWRARAWIRWLYRARLLGAGSAAAAFWWVTFFLSLTVAGSQGCKVVEFNQSAASRSDLILMYQTTIHARGDCQRR